MLNFCKIHQEYESLFNQDSLDPISLIVTKKYKFILFKALYKKDKELLSNLKSDYPLIRRVARESHKLDEFIAFIKDLEEKMSKE